VGYTVLQDQLGLYYSVQTLCWDDIIANDIITVIEASQLASGFVTCVILIPMIQITYLSASWIPHIRAKLVALDGCMLIEKTWAPYLQRRDDDSIMEFIADCKDLTSKEKQLANET